MKADRPLIEAKALSRIYPLGETSVVGLDGVELDIGKNEFVVIKGESGSGKTTLLSLLAGLDRPTSGSLFVAGHDLGRCNGKGLTQYRREVAGMVFQSFNLMPTLTVEENVCLPALLAGRALAPVQALAAKLLDRMGMTRYSRHRPGQLSGGEMQRCAIARALINDPAVILADEPTGNLDSRNAETVIALLAELKDETDTTVIVATHSRLADDYATMGFVLKDGTITDRL